MQQRHWVRLFGVALGVETALMLGFNFLLPPLPPLLEAGLDGMSAAVLVTLLVMLTGREIRNTAEQRYRAVVEDQTELICRWLPNGTLTFVNGAYCRYFQKTPEELLGKSFMPLIPEEDQAKVEHAVASLSPQNPVVTYSHRVYAPDGSIRWVEWTDRALYDAKGNTDCQRPTRGSGDVPSSGHGRLSAQALQARSAPRRAGTLGTMPSCPGGIKRINPLPLSKGERVRERGISTRCRS